MPLSAPWSAAFSEAWEAYKENTVPVGAVFADATGELRFRGRNQVYSAQTAALPLQHTRLAHAELNVLVQATPTDRLYEGILYITLEPCAMCVGAAVVCGIRHIRYGARDGSIGASELLAAHPFLASKNVRLEGPQSILGAASLVLMTDWILREDSETANRTIAAYRAEDARAVDLAQEWFRTGHLRAVAKDGMSSESVLEEMISALR